VNSETEGEGKSENESESSRDNENENGDEGRRENQWGDCVGLKSLNAAAMTAQSRGGVRVSSVCCWWWCSLPGYNPSKIHQHRFHPLIDGPASRPNLWLLCKLPSLGCQMKSYGQKKCGSTSGLASLSVIDNLF